MAILIFSWSTAPMIVLTPFLPFDVKTKLVITTTLIIIGNVTFYTGGFLVGREIFTRYKNRLNPKNWFRKKRQSGQIGKSDEE